MNECTEHGAVERAPEERSYTPPTDILETSDGYVLTVDLPGADPESLDLTYENDVLSIRAKTRRPEYAGFEAAHTEFEFGDYQRAFEISERLDADAIEASLRHGVLTVRLPKQKPARRKVAISSF